MKPVGIRRCTDLNRAAEGEHARAGAGARDGCAAKAGGHDEVLLALAVAAAQRNGRRLWPRARRVDDYARNDGQLVHVRRRDAADGRRQQVADEEHLDWRIARARALRGRCLTRGQALCLVVGAHQRAQRVAAARLHHADVPAGQRGVRATGGEAPPRRQGKETQDRTRGRRDAHTRAPGAAARRRRLALSYPRCTHSAGFCSMASCSTAEYCCRCCKSISRYHCRWPALASSWMR